MCLSFQITSSWCIDLFCDVLSLFYFALIFILCPLPLVSFVLFPGSFRCEIRLYVWGFSCLLRWACITIKFPLRTLLLYTTDFFYGVFPFSLSSSIFYFLWFLQSHLGCVWHTAHPTCVFVSWTYTASLPLAVSLERMTCINRDREWKLRERS